MMNTHKFFIVLSHLYVLAYFNIGEERNAAVLRSIHLSKGIHV